MTSHPLKFHPITGALITPLGYRKDGRAIWPVLGGDGTQPPAPAPQPPAPAPVPQPPAPVPQPPAPQPVPVPQPPYFQLPPGYQPYFQQQPAAPGTQPPAPAPVPQPPAPQQTPPNTGDPGFPANTPWRDMTSDQQVAYWQHQSRKHEQRVNAMADYEQLKQTAAEYQRMVEQTQTEHQRAVAEARRQGAAEALQGANDQIVEQWVRAAAHGRLGQESVDALLAGLNRQAFVTDGRVDTGRVWHFVSSLVPVQQTAPTVPTVPATAQPGTPAPASAFPAPAPAPAPAPQPPSPQPLTQGPDLGQGQPAPAPMSGLDEGREIARRRFAQQNTKPPVLQ